MSRRLPSISANGPPKPCLSAARSLPGDNRTFSSSHFHRVVLQCAALDGGGKMKRMTRLVMILAIAAVTMFLGRPASAQDQDFSKVQIKVTKVSGNIYMLEGAGGNISAAGGEDGIVIVDDQFAPLADKSQAALKDLGVTNKPVRFVINTHYHGDHTGGNEPFNNAGSTIIAHDNVRKRLETGGTAGNGASVKIEKDRKSTRLNSSHRCISYAVFCLKKKNRRSDKTMHERKQTMRQQ